jgi:hypothetical protein
MFSDDMFSGDFSDTADSNCRAAIFARIAVVAVYRGNVDA